MEEYQATPVKEVKIENELKRTMGFFTALSTVMGTVIGAGVFFKAASVAEVTGSASLHMFSWFLGGMISVCAGLTGAELAAAIPETGGMIKYIERIYGNTAAFLLGWAQVVIYFPASSLVDHFRYTVRQSIWSFPVNDCSRSCYSCCIDPADQFFRF